MSVLRCAYDGGYFMTMKALLLAGGRGSRLGVLTSDRPKPMLSIAGVPMIERIMASVTEQTGIQDFVIVTGYLANVIEEYFGDGQSHGWNVRYVHQDRPLGVAHAVNTAAPLLRDSDFLMSYGDIMLDPQNYGAAVAEFNDRRTVGYSAVVGLNWVEDPYAGSAVYLADDNEVVRIEEKPARGTAQTHWNSAGLFVFDPIIFDYTSSIAPSGRGEYELPDAVSAMIIGGHRALGFPIDGDWRDVGTPEDYAEINHKYGA